MQTLPYNIHSQFELVNARQKVIEAMSNQTAKLQYNLDYQNDADHVALNVNDNVFDIDANLTTYFARSEVLPIQRMALGKYGLGLDMSGNYVEDFKRQGHTDNQQRTKNTIQYLGLFIKYLKPDTLQTSIKQALNTMAAKN